MRKVYLVVKCIPLDDPYETDAHRVPYLITIDRKQALSFGYGYEVYETSPAGYVTRCIKDYDSED